MWNDMQFENTMTTVVPDKKIETRTRLIYILIMLWVGRVGVLIRQREDYAGIDALAMIQIVIVMMILGFLFLFPMARFRRQIQKSSLKFYFAYLGLGVVSALWSVNPEYSLYRAMEAIALSAAILYFCVSAPDVGECIRRVQLIIWPAILANWLGLILLIGFSFKLRLNGFGAMAALAASFFGAWMLAGKETRNRSNLFQMGMGLFFVIISWSLASWWSFWFGICYCAFFTRQKMLVISLVLIGVTIFFALGQDTRQELLLRDKKIENIESMTGRKKLWTDYMAASWDRPMLGYGFAVGAREVGTIYTTNAHNVFFGALLGVGWTGVVILGLFFVTLARELLRYKHFRYPAWLACASALAAGCLNNMSVSILGEQFTLATVIFVSFLGLHLVFLREIKTLPRDSHVKEISRVKPRRRFRIRW